MEQNFSITTYKHMPPITSFEAYKNYVYSIPNLSQEEEEYLFLKFKNENCLISAQKLVLSQLKTVVNMAKNYKSYGIPQEDLTQEGNVGLMKAVKNFDLNQKVRLYSYALIWIKSEIQSYIIKNWKIVKVATTKNLRKLFFSLKSTQKELFADNQVNINKELAKKLGVSEKEIEDMNSYLSSEDFFIDNNLDENNIVYELPYDSTPESEYELKHDEEVNNKKLLSALSQLNDNQRKVVEYKFYSTTKMTNKEIAEIMGISSERVRQIEIEAILKLRKHVVN